MAKRGLALLVQLVFFSLLLFSPNNSNCFLPVPQWTGPILVPSYFLARRNFLAR
jgi:hypothetical protein